MSTLAYCEHSKITVIKSFITSGSELYAKGRLVALLVNKRLDEGSSDKSQSLT